jgi:putative heme-binding domain-containing protein
MLRGWDLLLPLPVLRDRVRVRSLLRRQRPSPQPSPGVPGEGVNTRSPASASRPLYWLLTILCAIHSLAVRPALSAEADPDDPNTELHSFKVADGYEVHLFASEKDGIVKPVQMRWDPQGRLWVACIPSYPQLKPGERPDDRIVVLADTDDRGVANYSSVFARGLNLPLGLELGHGGLYVASGNDLLFMKDIKGDGKADETRIVLRGFFTGDAHQNINSFTWGPGGELMFCQGLHAFSHIETPYGNKELLKAGVWRLWPRTLQLESFLGRDRGPQNPWGIVFDDWGQPILISGNGQGIYYLLPSLIQTDHFLDPQQIWTRQGIKLCGVDIIGTKAMPAAAQGMMVAGSVLDNNVYLFELEDDASGFKVRQFTSLIASSDDKFRPVDAKVGPDGAIYIADWYNPIIGHYQASLRDPRRDHTHGRIWRVTATDLPPVQRPPLTSLPLAKLLDQLRSPERWARYQTKRLLSNIDSKLVTDALGEWIKSLDPSDPQYEYLLTEALGVYEEQEVVEPALLKQLLRAHDERARAYATGVIGHWHDRLEDPVGLLYQQAADESPRVRLEAVTSAAQVPSAGAMEAAATVVDRPMDKFLNNALTQAVHALKPYWKPALDAGQLSFGNKPARMEFVFKADGSPDGVQALNRFIRDGKPGEPAHDNSLLIIAGIGGPAELATVFADPTMHPHERATPLVAAALDAMAENYHRHKTAPPGDAASALRPLLGLSDPGSRRAAIVLAGLWHVEGLRPDISQIVRSTAPPAVRGAAMQALADLGGDGSRSELTAIASSGEPLEIRSLAIDALARLDLKAAADAAAKAFPASVTPIDVSRLLDALLTRQGGADALAQSLAQVTLSADIAKLALRAMNAAGRQDPALRELLSKASGIATGPRPYDAALVKTLADEAIASGDAAAGERVFRSQSTNCLSCHSIGGAGGTVGPDLATVGTAMPVELVVESVLWPNKQVKEGYMATLVETQDGEVQEGYVVSDEKAELTLKDPTTDHVFHFPKDKIKRRKEIGSLMPEGVTDGLTHQELRDLIRFLCQLGKPGPYHVSSSPFVRVWQTLDSVPEPVRVAAAANPNALPQIDTALWQYHYATVSGELPGAEVSPVDGSPLGFARFEADVITPGRFRLKIAGGPGITLWVDGRPAEVRDAVEMDLPAGKHWFTFRANLAQRGAAGISCILEPLAGSEARLLQKPAGAAAGR